VPDAWHQQLQDGTFVDVQGIREWWTIFDDPTLNSLMQSVAEQNLDLFAALQRICLARERVNVVRSARLLQLDKTGTFSHRQTEIVIPGFSGFVSRLLEIDFWTSNLDASWEPDVFGRVAREIDASSATYQASIEDYRDIMVTLYAEVAVRYVQLRTLQKRLAVTQQNAESQRASLRLADIRVKGGVSPVLDSYQAQTNLSSTESDIPPIEQAIQETLNRLAVLLGEYPRSLHCELIYPAPIPNVPDELPMALPRDMVRQRPDIRQAERQLAARTAEVGVAVADLYPRFSINGTFGFGAEEFSDLFSSSAWNFRVGPSFRWAIFHSGRIRASIRSSECAVREALAVYEQTLLLAAEEVENGIVAYNKEVERRVDLERAVKAAQQSLESVLDIYRAGNTDFLNVLDTQRALFILQNQLAVSEGLAVVNLISFYKALGGGWDPRHHCNQRNVRLQCPPDCPLDYTPPAPEDSLENDNFFEGANSDEALPPPPSDNSETDNDQL
jgi:NodT family efflux transporter outer membrane factor (OMF) lipoprotein